MEDWALRISDSVPGDVFPEKMTHREEWRLRGAKSHGELTQSLRIPLRGRRACEVVGLASVAETE